MNSNDITQKTIQSYNRQAAAYAERWVDFSLDEELDKFAEYLKPGWLILDAGCGPGRDMRAWRQRGYRVIGLDRSAGMLQEAAKRGATSLVMADLRQLPFAKHSFNGVWASASLLHLPKSDLLPALKESNRVLEHGHLYLALKGGQDEVWLGDKEQGQRFFAFYHPAEVELALERADFHVLSRRLTPDGAGRGHRWINVIGWTKLITPRVGTNAIIFNEAGQTLLTRRADNGLWCIPGGHLDFDEDIRQTAIREALEETGLTVEIERLVGMYSVTYPAGTFPEKRRRGMFIVAFRCRATGGELTLNDEVTEFGWFHPQDLPDDLIMFHAERILEAAR